MCGEEDGTDSIVCEGGTEPIVCVNGGLSKYGFTVDAHIAKDETSHYNVTFKYLDENGVYTEAKEQVVENQRLVPFHIHQTVDKEEKQYVFRYWKLTSGNVTSSLTIMSDCTFDAVYDEMEEFPPEEVMPEDVPIVIEPWVETRDDGQEHPVCDYYYKPDESNDPDSGYCTFVGQNPRDYKWDSESKCPYLKMMLAIW